jgi:hypothetical protein
MIVVQNRVPVAEGYEEVFLDPMIDAVRRLVSEIEPRLQTLK